MALRQAPQSWHRWREPLALVLLIIAGVRLLAGIVAVPILAGEDAYGSFADAAMFEARRTFDVVLLLGAAGAAASCLLPPPTPRARVLVTIALIETAAGVLVALGFGLMGLASDSGGRVIELVYLLLGLVLPVAVVIALLLALRATSPAPAQPQLPPNAAVANAGVQLPPPGAPAPPPDLPAAWQPDQATGRVWTTAGDAARGAPAAGWPVESGAGWQPIPGSPEQPRSS